jgi:hypothetical protein
MKTVTHVYARFVTHVCALCREGEEIARIPKYLKIEMHPLSLFVVCPFSDAASQRLGAPGTANLRIPK